MAKSAEEILKENGYVKLSPKEARQSKATHQHNSMYPDERYALTVNLTSDGWTVFDDRGDVAAEGTDLLQFQNELEKIVSET